MSDVECQRRLVQFAAAHVDAGGFATERMPAVGANRKLRRNRFTTGQIDDDGVVTGVDGSRFVVEPGKISDCGSSLFESRYQDVVLDIVPKHVQADFVASECDLRRPDEATGVVDQPH